MPRHDPDRAFIACARALSEAESASHSTWGGARVALVRRSFSPDRRSPMGRTRGASAPRAADNPQSFAIVTTSRRPTATGVEPGRFDLATKGLVGLGAFRLSS